MDVDASDEISETDSPIPTPDTFNPVSTNLLDLNDDCQVEICRLLPLVDLRNIAMTSMHLRKIAGQVFVLSPTNTRLNVLDLLRSFNSKIGSDSMLQQIELLLQNFGHSIREIVFDLTNESRTPLSCYEHMKQPIFALITKYCSDGGALEAFRGTYLNLEPSSRTFFSRLTTIRLEYCQNVGPAISDSKKCHTLTLDGEFGRGRGQFNYYFPMLESLALRFEFSLCRKFCGDCERFLRRHTNLKVLKIDVTYGFTDHLDAIFELKQLQVLKIYGENEYGHYCSSSATSTPTSPMDLDEAIMPPIALHAICGLTNLKALVLDCGSFEFCACSESVIAESLEYLALYHSDVDISIVLKRFNKLRVLKLNDCSSVSDEYMLKLNLDKLTDLILEDIDGAYLTVDGLVDIFDKFQKLRSITLWLTDHVIDSAVYDKFVNICRNQHRQLTITLIDGWTPLSNINYAKELVDVKFKGIDDFKYRKPKIRRYKHSYIK